MSSSSASSSTTAVSESGEIMMPEEPPAIDNDGLASYIETADHSELREVLRAGLQSVRDHKTQGRSRLRALVFTRQFSAFDGRNQHSSNNLFHGFYTLFWLSVALFVLKIGAQNWAAHGNPLGTNEIMNIMFSREVVVLLASDGIMCGLTGVSWLFQRAVLRNLIDWDREGWIIQHIWQTLFIGCVVWLPFQRDWPWPHTVYFVLHGLIMVMKQHSYAFYNGYLSTMHKQRRTLLLNLDQLEQITPARRVRPSAADPVPDLISASHLDCVPSAREQQPPRLHRRHQSAVSQPHIMLAGPDGGRGAGGDSSGSSGGSGGSDIDMISSAIASGQPLDLNQIRLFERVIRWNIDAYATELQGSAADPARAYPSNLTLANHYDYIPLPTLVYNLEYPRTETVNWAFVAEKLTAMLGTILVMVMVSQAFIYPVVVKTMAMKESGLPLARRLQEFPSLLGDLLFPFMMEYLLAWYLIWETILNVLAEVTCFADRSFYDAWWNSVSWDEFARDWNRPVHNFLLRHVYHSSISSMKVNKHTATLITFFLSACVHELVMWCIFRKLRGYLLVLQMCQIPLVRLSRSKWLRGRKVLGNFIFWLGIFTGPSLLCSLYLVL